MVSAAHILLDLVDRSGLSKSELSRRSGVSRALLDGYLKAERQPSVAQVERLGEAAGLRLDIAWTRQATWFEPSTTMQAPPTTVAERAEILERVVPVAMELRRHPRGDLEFPSFRAMARG